MKLSYLVAMSLGLAPVAQALDLDKLTQVGAAVENRKTGERLVLKCAEVDEEDGLKVFSECYFVRGYALKGGKMQVLNASDEISDLSDATSGINPEAIAKILTPSDRVKIQDLTGHLFGSYRHYDQYEYENENDVGYRFVDYAAIWNLWPLYIEDAEDRSHGGALWRGAALTISTPVIAAVNTGAIAGAVITDGLRYAGEGAYVGVKNGVQKVRYAAIRARAKKAVSKLQNASLSDKTIKVSDRVYSLIAGAAFGVDLEEVMEELREMNDEE